MDIRKATTKDIKDIHRIVNTYAGQGLLLPRSLSDLYDHLRDYFVLEEDNSIYGVCALRICWEDLAEIRSLAISREKWGRGLGSRLVYECMNEARKFEIKQVFALTYVPDFFMTLGFKRIQKDILPHKIWADCLRCPKFPNCDETAMMIDLA